MSNLIRWEPMREMATLRDAMDRLFDDAFTRSWGLSDGGHGMGGPAVDLYQTDDDVVVQAAVPGMKPEDVQISVTGDTLSIKGETKQESNTKEKAYHIREQRWGSFERTLTLPTAVKSDKATAEFENGVLTVTLPKADVVKPKVITVKAR
ncbi:MAG TPA: Hsp20/alpha crystallin family protein [Anaerolineales bacterium]